MAMTHPNGMKLQRRIACEWRAARPPSANNAFNLRQGCLFEHLNALLVIYFPTNDVHIAFVATTRCLMRYKK